MKVYDHASVLSGILVDFLLVMKVLIIAFVVFASLSYINDKYVKKQRTDVMLHNRVDMLCDRVRHLEDQVDKLNPMKRPGKVVIKKGE